MIHSETSICFKCLCCDMLKGVVSAGSITSMCSVVTLVILGSDVFLSMSYQHVSYQQRLMLSSPVMRGQCDLELSPVTVCCCQVAILTAEKVQSWVGEKTDGFCLAAEGIIWQTFLIG
jgi:hypothetical protein